MVQLEVCDSIPDVQADRLNLQYLCIGCVGCLESVTLAAEKDSPAYPLAVRIMEDSDVPFQQVLPKARIEAGGAACQDACAYVGDIVAKVDQLKEQGLVAHG